jgi:hypothetical protein
MTEWKSMESAPKDGTEILAWCVHSADQYFLPDGKLTLYGGHTEVMSHVDDGAHVLVWGGSWDDSTYEYSGGHMPDWWFRADSEFEVTANPVAWFPIEKFNYEGPVYD